MRATEIWTTGYGDTVRPTGCHVPVWVSESGTTPLEDPASPPEPTSVLLLPIEPAGSACGVTIVPDAATSLALVNGVRVGAGLHVLHHADRMTVSGRAFWLSISTAPEEVTYDPESHGDRVYCFRTKALLATGDRMVICRGTPEADCQMKFTAAAWSVNMPCHGCGAVPSAPAWTPPAAQAEGSLEQLLRLAREA